MGRDISKGGEISLRVGRDISNGMREISLRVERERDLSKGGERYL